MRSYLEHPFPMQKHHVYAILGLIAGLLVGLIICKSMSPAIPAIAPISTQSMDHAAMGHGSMMQNEMDAMTAGLQNKSGDEFDKTFLDEMIVHHQGAIDMAELVLQKSNRPELKQLANEIITAQTKEIGQMESWLQEWYK
jgi:uncharacterized protein (DUF305 family)